MGRRGNRWAGVRRLAVAAALVAGACGAQAQTREGAQEAAVADALSTAAGLALGAVEVNPLGPLLAIGMKAAMLQHAKTLPDTEQPAAYAMAESVWGGAAANNMCITAAILTGGGFAPACIAQGVAWGMKTWKDSERERQFWEGCALLRQYANEPKLACVYDAAVAKAEAKAQQQAREAGAVLVTILDDEEEPDYH